MAQTKSQRWIKSDGIIALARQWTDYRLLAVPLMGAALGDILVSAVDTAIIGHLGRAALGGATAALSIYTIFSELVGAAIVGYQVISARVLGGDHPKDLRIVLATTLRLILPIALVSTVILLIFGRYLLGVIIGPHEVVVNFGSTYLLYRALSLPFLALTVIARSTIDVSKKSAINFRSRIVLNVVNGLVGISLAFGIGPLPAMGIAGAGLGALCARVASLLYILWESKKAQILATAFRGWQWTMWTKIVRLSSPEMANVVFDYAANLAVIFFAARLGVQALGTFRVLYTYLTLAFAVSMGLGWANQIRVGRSLGKGDLAQALEHNKYGSIFAVALLTVITLIFIVFAPFLVGLLSPSTEVGVNANHAMMLIGILAPIMGLSSCVTGTLRAFGKTGWVMYSNIATVWFLQIPSSWLFAMHLRLGLLGLILGFGLYFGARIAIGLIITNKLFKQPTTVTVSSEV